VSFENITQAEWGYFAGIIDGEGCICIHGQKTKRRGKVYVYYSLFLTVGNTSYSMVKWLHDRFGGSLWPGKKIKSNKQCWHWGTASQQAENLVRLVSPYLVAKIDQAEIAIRFRDSYKGNRPCTYRPLSPAVTEFREQCKQELNRAKRVQTVSGGAI
jgi:hypothetical protein